MKTYTVVPGDTMWGIAIKHGMELNKLLAINPQIKNSSLIYPGQMINISTTDASTYMVVPGDTMWGIAAKHGMELNKLLAANPQITNSTLIYPGKIIHISKNDKTPSTPTVPETPSTPSTPSTSDDVATLEKEVIRLVNEERAKVGSSPLTGSEEISRIARIKSQDFINNNYFSHNSPRYGTPFDMLRSFGIPYTAAAENIASGQRTANDVMNSWMSSSGHRANILNSTYNKIGVGAAKDSSGKTYWTQMFIKD